jgi:prephenate dehydrogenase
MATTTQAEGGGAGRCVVVGANGQFGRVFAQKLAAEGVAVSGVDRQEARGEGVALGEYVGSDITDPSAGARRLLGAAECVLLCTPEEAVLRAIPLLREITPADCLVIDIASVKSRIDAALAAAGFPRSYLSIHPMFGPTADFADRNVCVVAYAEGGRAVWFTGLLAKWRARVTRLTAEAHDRATAYTQALPHAAILSFADALVRSGDSYELTTRLATPIHSTMLSLLARIVSGDPELYWDIQSDNPYAAEAREQLGLSLARLEEAIGGPRPNYFPELFGRVSAKLADDRAALREVASRIVDLAKAP